jgi:hypothetical protein
LGEVVACRFIDVIGGVRQRKAMEKEEKRTLS